ncbi:MAG: hypothetical protein K9N51_02390 [Candidatus Pacebacteria bacterium]|nr:hypothetical protein [Candidatus Paceibacterota bacterium]
MISAYDIRRAVPILTWLEKHGVEVKRTGKEYACKCLFHADRSPSMRINAEKNLWFCDPCGFGGTVIDLEFRHSGTKVKEAMRKLAIDANLIDPANEPMERTATYQYRDALGRDVMCVDRVEKLGLDKKFSQWRKDESGKRVDGIAGVQRVLYRMEKWAGAGEVALCEGEKCAEAMEALGYMATSNSGGSNGWFDSYASYLAGKHVDVWPDKDGSGEKWLTAVLASLEGKVESLRVMKVSDPYNDVADVVQAQGEEYAHATIAKIMMETCRIPRGVSTPLLSVEECYTLYRKRVNEMDDLGVDFGKWLPSFRSFTRALLPGDMAVILSDTGVGKTTILSNLAKSQAPIPTIFFELELSAEAMCERFIAIATGTPTMAVERRTKEGKTFDLSKMAHVWICPDSKVTIEKMEEIINRAELRIGKRPGLVLIDYIGLMGGGGSGKRYERLSTIAEGLKILAKSTNTVVIVASQIRRREDMQSEVGLHDAKDSGSIENSAQLVVSATRPAVDRMKLAILKQTKRAGKATIDCNFNGDLQTITEMVPDDGLSGDVRYP